MKKAVYIGNFDPVTLGHMDIIQRAARITEKLVIGVLNTSGRTFLFTLEQRMKQLKAAVAELSNVDIQVCGSGSVDFARLNHADTIIRGVRNIADFDHELHMVHMNHKMEPDIDTIFLSANIKYSFLNSGIVRDLVFHKKDVSQFVPQCVAETFISIV